MRNALLSTLFHILELALCAALAIGVAVAAKHFFAVDISAAAVGILTLVLDGAGKLLRASPASPVPDYVNDTPISGE